MRELSAAQKPAVIKEDTLPNIFDSTAPEDRPEYIGNIAEGGSESVDSYPQQEYFLEEFGKLKLPYFPEKIGLFSGTNGINYILMSMDRDLIVFIIQAIFK